MSEIKVDFPKLNSCSTAKLGFSSETDQLGDGLNALRNTLEFDIISARGIGTSLRDCYRELETHRDTLKKMGDYLAATSRNYQRTENTSNNALGGKSLGEVFLGVKRFPWLDNVGPNLFNNRKKNINPLPGGVEWIVEHTSAINPVWKWCEIWDEEFNHNPSENFATKLGHASVEIGSDLLISASVAAVVGLTVCLISPPGLVLIAGTGAVLVAGVATKIALKVIEETIGANLEDAIDDAFELEIFPGGKSIKDVAKDTVVGVSNAVVDFSTDTVKEVTKITDGVAKDVSNFVGEAGKNFVTGLQTFVPWLR